LRPLAALQHSWSASISSRSGHAATPPISSGTALRSCRRCANLPNRGGVFATCVGPQAVDRVGLVLDRRIHFVCIGLQIRDLSRPRHIALGSCRRIQRLCFLRGCTTDNLQRLALSRTQRTPPRGPIRQLSISSCSSPLCVFSRSRLRPNPSCRRSASRSFLPPQTGMKKRLTIEFCGCVASRTQEQHYAATSDVQNFEDFVYVRNKSNKVIKYHIPCTLEPLRPYTSCLPLCVRASLAPSSRCLQRQPPLVAITQREKVGWRVHLARTETTNVVLS
jgi:hypothetical protein